MLSVKGRAAGAAQGDDGSGHSGGLTSEPVAHRCRLGGDAAHLRADGGGHGDRSAAVDVCDAGGVPADAQKACVQKRLIALRLH